MTQRPANSPDAAADGGSLDPALPIGFIGGGNMATALIGGLIANGHQPGAIRVADIDPARCTELGDRYAVVPGANNAAVAEASSVVVLAVKPQQLPEVASELARFAGDQRLFISIAAGVRDDSMRAALGQHAHIVRCMPNTPALVRAGITALFPNANVSAPERATADAILRAAGATLWVEDEGQLDAVTAVSGSGPAYFFRMIELLQRSAEQLGLSEAAARDLSLHTALGAATLASASDEPAGVLRARVTSPGGTTAAALNTLDDGGFETLFHAAVRAAFDRSRELGAASAPATSEDSDR